jgi:hypothetical protein
MQLLAESNPICLCFFFLLSRELLQLFIAAELIHWGTLCQQYEQVLRVGDASTPATNVFTVGEFDNSFFV